MVILYLQNKQTKLHITQLCIYIKCKTLNMWDVCVVSELAICGHRVSDAINIYLAIKLPITNLPLLAAIVSPNGYNYLPLTSSRVALPINVYYTTVVERINEREQVYYYYIYIYIRTKIIANNSRK